MTEGEFGRGAWRTASGVIVAHPVGGWIPAFAGMTEGDEPGGVADCFRCHNGAPCRGMDSRLRGNDGGGVWPGRRSGQPVGGVVVTASIRSWTGVGQRRGGRDERPWPRIASSTRMRTRRCT